MTGLIWTGTPDLQSCDREPIHIPGSIQSHGLLFACEPVTWRIVQCSANAQKAFAAARKPDASLSCVFSAAVLEQLAAELAASSDAGGVLVARRFDIKAKGKPQKVNVAAHAFGGKWIVELEDAAAQAAVAPLDLIRRMMARLQQSRTLNDLCEQTVQQLRDLIGFDRVMIYRFLQDGSGQVVSEARADDIEPLLNLRYPATDIPVQARELYKRNWVRLIADVGSRPVALVAMPGCEGPLDLSHADLRSVSPIHIEYLVNMGVGASMSISIIVGGELWGLIACHHRTAQRVASNVRAAVEVLGQVFSLQIQTVEGIDAYVTMRAARALLDRIVAEFPIDGALAENLAGRLEQLSSFIPCDGAGIYLDGIWHSTGAAPSSAEARVLAAHIDGHIEGHLYASHHLPADFPLGDGWKCSVRGVLAVPLSYEGGSWLMFFRREVAQTIEWGGDWTKAPEANAIGRISPRKSFQAWKEVVRGQSLPWTSRERLIADTLRVYLLDIVIRFSDVITEERRQAQQRQRMLTSELNQRVKGTLDLIQSLVHHGYDDEGRIQDFVRTLEGRIRAIALAHDSVSLSSACDVRNLVEAAISMQGGHSGHIEVEGPDVRLEPRAYTVLALVLHEMATRSVRAGALATAEGRLHVNWFIEDNGRLIVLWDETGRLPGRLPPLDELSSMIIKRNIPHSLGGEVQIATRESGLRATFVIPARCLANPPAPEIARETRSRITQHKAPLAGYSILLFEEHMPVALTLERQLRDRGAADVSIAGTVDGALELIAKARPDVALIDAGQAADVCRTVATALGQHEIPFVLGGVGDVSALPEILHDAPSVERPYAPDAVAEALKEALVPHLIRAVLSRLS